jgi:phospholipase/carboxylesterase
MVIITPRITWRSRRACRGTSTDQADDMQSGTNDSGDMTATPDDPHGTQPLRTSGVDVRSARAAVVMVHGRGASAESILTLASALRTTDVAFVAPQAAGGTWYPYSFLSPMPLNEPGITSGMQAVARAVAHLEAHGMPPERTVLLGFSQGACLASEFAARHARRYGGIVALSGGLIGPDGTPRDYAGSLDGTPAFLGCSDVDPHIPAARVHETARVLGQLGATVDMRLYPGMGHGVIDDEIQAVQQLLGAITA